MRGQPWPFHLRVCRRVPVPGHDRRLRRGPLCGFTGRRVESLPPARRADQLGAVAIGQTARVMNDRDLARPATRQRTSDAFRPCAGPRTPGHRTNWICMSSYRQNDQFCMHRDARRPFAACTNIPVESSGVSEPLIGSSYARDAGWSSSVVQRHCCRDLVVGNWSGKGLTALRPFRTRSSSPSALHGRVGLSRLCVGGKASYQWSRST